MTNPSTIFVVVEATEGRPIDLCYEMLGLARRLVAASGGAVHACVLGNGLDEVGDELIAHGADQVYVVDAPVFAEYQADAWLPDLVGIVANVKPAAVMVGHTAQGGDLGAASGLSPRYYRCHRVQPCFFRGRQAPRDPPLLRGQGGRGHILFDRTGGVHGQVEML